MSKIMGYYRLWVVTEMGYDRVDCSTVSCFGTVMLLLHEIILRARKIQKVELKVYDYSKISLCERCPRRLFLE